MENKKETDEDINPDSGRFKGETMKILTLILKITLLILSGIQATEALVKIADESGEELSKLRCKLPAEFKKS